MTIRQSLPAYDRHSSAGLLWNRFKNYCSGLFAKGGHLSEAELIRLRKQMKDYARGGVKSYRQRQVSYLGFCLLIGLYYDLTFGFTSFILLQIAENLELHISIKVRRWSGRDARTALQLQQLLLVAALFSSSMVGLIALVGARLEGHTTHFAPLIFLFSTALNGAVNNRQMPSVLFGRLLNYGFVFLLIPIADIWAVRPGFDSVLWLQLASVVFALYIVVSYSLVYLSLYQRNLDQLDDLKQERDRAKSASAAKSQFVSVVSHELRTPLTSIIGSLDLLANGVLDDKPAQSKRILGIAHRNGKHLSTLINDLLDLQRVDSGNIIYQIKPVNMGHLVEEAVASIGGFANSSDVKLKITSSEQNACACADSDRMLQVLSNLLSNAIKFSKSGGKVLVSLWANEDSIHISVKDFGIGIPENSHDLVFGKFSQIDQSDRRVFGGSGLGMNITKQILEVHGGTVDFVSELGKGSEFTVTLPRFHPQDLTKAEVGDSNEVTPLAETSIRSGLPATTGRIVKPVIGS